MTRGPVDRVSAYAKAVVAGEIVAGVSVRLACERHLRDLDTGADRGLRFDVGRADRAIDFFAHLKHSKGKAAGQAFVLSPWQVFIVGCLFGWMRADGTRRFRQAYSEIARKNGKSTLSAGIAILLAFFDGEPGAEVYCAATKRDQAKIVFDEAKRMVEKTPALKKRLVPQTFNIHQTATSSKLEPLGADADTLDGLNIHGAVVDELHAHKTRAVVDVLETATGARQQPLQFYITTAGFDRHSVCWHYHQYSVQVLEGVFVDDSWFAFVATIDEGDEWTDERVWAKANPNLGVSVYVDDLRRKATKAKQMPAAQNAFRRLHLDQWTEQADRWIDIAAWDACAGVPHDDDAFRGRTCYVGLDLSSTKDLSAAALVFPDDDGGYDVLMKFWIPEDELQARVERDHVPYDVWLQEAHLEATPGNVIDYDRIREAILDLVETYDVREIGYDPWNATQLMTQLQANGAQCFPVRQGFASLSAPTKLLETLVLGKQLRHGGHPVLRWNASNVAVEQDAAGNVKPSKKKSTDRIDGIAALVNALDRASRNDSDGEAWFESHPIVTA